MARAGSPQLRRSVVDQCHSSCVRSVLGILDAALASLPQDQGIVLGG
jgi:hypothetical protein